MINDIIDTIRMFSLHSSDARIKISFINIIIHHIAISTLSITFQIQDVASASYLAVASNDVVSSENVWSSWLCGRCGPAQTAELGGPAAAGEGEREAAAAVAAVGRRSRWIGMPWLFSLSLRRMKRLKKIEERRDRRI